VTRIYIRDILLGNRLAIGTYTLPWEKTLPSYLLKKSEKKKKVIGRKKAPGLGRIFCGDYNANSSGLQLSKLSFIKKKGLTRG